MIRISGLGHINIVIENLKEGIDYYTNLFNCIPLQAFPNFKNEGFSLSAGFIENCNDVDVSICFLQIPDTTVVLELMQYHSPEGKKGNQLKKTNDIGGLGHICLKTTDIDVAFEHIKTMPETKLISEDERYSPVYISPIEKEQFHFFDYSKESDPIEKQIVCDIIKNIRYFYFIDKYNIQWELEEGHHDIG